LYDSLRKQHFDFLERERTLLQPLAAARWHLRLVPYPLDADTATAVTGIIDNTVLPWGVVESSIEKWAYSSFFEWAVRVESSCNRIPRREAEAKIPGLETLRLVFEGIVPESRGGAWAEEFLDECDILRGTIEGLLVAEPTLAGSYVPMPHLPLGPGWLNCVPLHEQVWIDRRIVELCEASAILADDGYTRLSGDDLHSLAWHRFFRRGSHWKAPKPAPRTEFIVALNHAVAAVSVMPARKRLVADRPFIRIDDYVSWTGRRGQCDYQALEEGIAVSRWNKWIQEYAVDGQVDLLGSLISGITNPFCLRQMEGIAAYPTVEDAELTLAERMKAVAQLRSAGQGLAIRSAGSDIRSERQWKILEKLQGRAMTAEELCGEIDCDRRTLFKSGGITELIEAKLVANDRKVGGYYRLDFPPTSHEKRGH
jgi:hypothetical protein